MTATSSCCERSKSPNQGEGVKEYIRETYAELAKSPREGSCCFAAKRAGYSEDQLAALPESARAIAAGCGNPTALAGLKPGEVVLDLGSGGGIDVLLAAKLVGPEGRAIGVDITPEMVAKARENAAKMGVANVEFRLGEVEQLPIPDGSVDVVISNCVINLSQEKGRVFKEAYRVLKRGGRLLVSDIMVEGLPEALRESLAARAACIGGATSLEEYLGYIKSAGFTNIRVVHKEAYPKELVKGLRRAFLEQGCCGPGEPQGASSSSVEVISLEVMHAEVEAWK